MDDSGVDSKCKACVFSCNWLEDQNRNLHIRRKNGYYSTVWKCFAHFLVKVGFSPVRKEDSLSR